MYVTSDMPVE